MAAIFAIIAICRQDIFAIVAIYLFAIIANNNNMSDLDQEDRRWLTSQFVGKPKGAKSEAAEAAGITSTMLSRILNSGEGEIRAIKPAELRAFAEYFNDTPPSLRRIAAIEIAPNPIERRGGREIVRIPLLDRISAGKLRAPVSQIPEREIKWLTLSGMGPGDFVAFQLDADADSIDRAAPPGSILIVDKKDNKLRTGKFYVFSLDGEVTTKQWQDGPPPYLAPFSLNPIHKPKFIKRRRDLEIIGRVKRAVVDL